MFNMKCSNGCCNLKTWKIPKICSNFYTKDDRAGVILIYQNKYVLVVRTHLNNWGFPKGSVNKHESVVDAASRELHEETGIYISPEIIANEGIHWKGCHNDLYILNVSTKILPNIDIIHTDVYGVGWVNINCMVKNCSLLCNLHFRQFLYIVKKKGLKHFLQNPFIRQGEIIQKINIK